MKLSILDQSPISANHTAKEALEASLKLAQHGEKYGYSRYWIAEHHDLSGLACPAPEIMLSYIGAQTNTIRIGSGAVLLPYYKPYKVAEVFNMLATLFPDRIDIGLGRAPGGSAEASQALSDHFLKGVWSFPDSINDLLHFLDNDFPEDHPYAKVKAAPIPKQPPHPWLLGTSKKSAILASEKGISYVFGHFMSDKDGPAIVEQYREVYSNNSHKEKPYVIIAATVFCAETTEKAEEIALSSLIWSIQRESKEGNQGVPSIENAKNTPLSLEEKAKFEAMKEKIIFGNPAEVKQKLDLLQNQYHADELMIVTITYDPSDKYESYRLIAQEYKIF
ncbi:LLM class flavin-dependent oxidoreductase [Cytobacillus gottheilii]|uniref:LLM class flavin-dependent oxidoreductase n=1 Tax=Cytobacillus gottheilii TaxID=859144 RepID=UPI003CF01FFC